MKLRSVGLIFLVALGSASCSLPRWPVEGTLTSPFGIRFQGLRPGLHRGVDVAVPVGTAVRAMKGGRVRFAGTMSGYGRVVWLQHSGGLLSVYAHLSEVHVQAGQPVDDRQVIGLSGLSGNARGAHLHFEIWRRGREIDPVPFLGDFPSG